MPPVLYIKNALKIAEDGHLDEKGQIIGPPGDGTVYASSTSASVDQDNKRLTLTTGFSRIADINGAAADDQFNGYVAYFPNSKNVRHVVDWVESSKQATVDETPDLVDHNQPCELRRSLYEGNSLASNPVHLLVDGFLHTKWRGKQANQLQRIEVCLPNLVGQGGFEELAVGALPTSDQGIGKWSQNGSGWAISATSPILGSRMSEWTPGGSDADLFQKLTGSVKKGKTYRLILKAKTTGGSTNVGAIDIYIQNKIIGGSAIDSDWQTDQSYTLGVISTTAQWFTSPDFVPEYDTDSPVMFLKGVVGNKGAATTVQIDEVYIWEVVNVGALLVFNHNWNGNNQYSVYGFRTGRARTNWGTDEYSNLFINETKNGTAPFEKEFTTAVFPIYEIECGANANFQYEAGVIRLDERRPLIRHPKEPQSPRSRKLKEEIQESISGVRFVYKYNQRRTLKFTYPICPDSDLAMFEDHWRPYHHDVKNPFAVKFDSTDQVLLVQDIKNTFEPMYNTKRPDIDFEWEEVIA
jgi:hypothetical protein